MYNTTGAITGVSLDGSKKATAFDKIQKYMFNKLNTNNNHISKGGAGASGPSIYGYGFAAGNSYSTAAANIQ